MRVLDAGGRPNRLLGFVSRYKWKRDRRWRWLLRRRSHGVKPPAEGLREGRGGVSWGGAGPFLCSSFRGYKNHGCSSRTRRSPKGPLESDDLSQT